MALEIPHEYQRQIQEALASLPELSGRITVEITFHCTPHKTIGSVEMSRKFEQFLAKPREGSRYVMHG